MPDRRAVAYGVGEGLSNMGETLRRRADIDKQNKVIQDRQMLDDLATRVNKGELEPEQADQAATLQKLPVPKGYFHTLVPTVESRLASALGTISKAPDESQVPSLQQLDTMVPRRVSLSARPQGQKGFTEAEGADYMKLAGARADKIAAYPATRVDRYDPENKQNVTSYIRHPEGNYPTEPTPEQAGANLSARTIATVRGENEGGLPGMKGEAKKQEALAGDLSPEITRAKANQESAVTHARARAEIAEQVNQMGLSSAQKDAALQMSDDFYNQSKQYFERESSVNDMMRLASSAPTSAAASIGFVFKYMKALDPGSTVREGEQAQVRDATSLLGRVQNFYNQLVIGKGTLNAEQVNDFLLRAKDLYQSELPAHQQRLADFATKADTLRIPIGFITGSGKRMFDTEQKANSIKPQGQVISTDPNWGAQ